MITLGCLLGRMCDITLPQFLDGNAPSIRDFFWAESGKDIALNIDGSALMSPLKPGQQAYGAFDLHQATLFLTHNPPPSARSERIAVLFANYYAPNTKVLGMMFDRGFATWDDPNDAPMLTASPREGCAIFLQAILNLRQGGFPAQQEAFYTTIHEMGHIFNLIHSPPVPPSAQFSNVMATSQTGRPYPPPYHFVGNDRNQLHACSTSPFVWPGGTEFQDRGDWSGGADLANWYPSRAPGLDLRIETSRFEFWKFEPVELVIEVSVSADNPRSYSVPDMIDPGYANFVIWLENPNGERRRYRSPRLYCANPGIVRITPNRPFRRDISIFGESGGYTFNRSGIWRIWTEFDAGPRKRLRSNSVEVEVRSARTDHRYEQARLRLSNGPAARLLYHRQLRHASDAREALLAQIDENQSIIPTGGIEYAVGRSLLSADASLAGEKDHERGIELLRSARDHSDIGAVQRAHADRLIEQRPRRLRTKSEKFNDWGDQLFMPASPTS